MSFRVSEGMALASFPVFGFIAALLFEMGYADAFGYSYDLIDIDLKLTLAAMAVIALIFTPLFIYCWFMLWAARRGGVLGKLAAIQMAMPLPMLIMWYMTGFQSRNLAIGLMVAALVALLPLIKLGYLCLRHDLPMALGIMAASQQINAGAGKGADRQVAWYDKVFAIFMLALCAVVLVVMTYGVGSFFAYNKSRFSMFISEGKEYVILSAYADRFVVGGITGKVFNGNVYVFAKNSERLINVRKKRYDSFWSRLEP